jgi:hypothetical protein
MEQMREEGAVETTESDAYVRLLLLFMRQMRGQVKFVETAAQLKEDREVDEVVPVDFLCNKVEPGA